MLRLLSTLRVFRILRVRCIKKRVSKSNHAGIEQYNIAWKRHDHESTKAWLHLNHPAWQYNSRSMQTSRVLYDPMFLLIPKRLASFGKKKVDLENPYFLSSDIRRRRSPTCLLMSAIPTCLLMSAIPRSGEDRCWCDT